MKDFPVFTTEHGAASLTLREIPYRGNAYIRIQSALTPDELLKDCTDFCRAAGAKHIFACGDDILRQFPAYTEIWRMAVLRGSLPEPAVSLFPLQQKTAELWRNIYNDKMKNVSLSSYMAEPQLDQLIQSGKGYFVHQSGELLGIGKAGTDRIDAIASLKPGAGRKIVSALASVCSEEVISVEVSSENQKAVALYESMGFVRQQILSTWYKIL